MKKSDRQKIFDKYDGRCAYCGCELAKGWHVDELEPCRRLYEFEAGHWQEDGMIRRWIPAKNVLRGYEYPERLHIDNQMPSCASCNINKHSMGLEDFRSLISGFMKHLNEISTQYKIAKRYGLVTETIKPIVFHFEKIQSYESNNTGAKGRSEGAG